MINVITPQCCLILLDWAKAVDSRAAGEKKKNRFI